MKEAPLPIPREHVTDAATERDHRKGPKVIAEKETRTVRALRLLVISVLVLVAASGSSFVFLVTRKAETDAFESHFYSLGHKLTDDISRRATKLLTAMDGLSLAYTSHGLTVNSSFPFATLPDIERRGRNVIQLANVVSLGVSPIVKVKDKEAWLKYSQENSGWLSEGLALQEAIASSGGSGANPYSHGNQLDLNNVTDIGLPPFFHGIGSNGKHQILSPNAPGDAVPVWQVCETTRIYLSS